ncbi:MAG: chromosome segregation SMC family protein [Halocynthiibacter sp.]
MRFSKLRLNGFKSFVDPTDLIISDGLTGVVGPNGCGKSNLLEALRWVMGENRPKAMRGGGMEDVIFAGAASRPARHFAEVSLTLDNQERLAPAGFNDEDTLEVVRRITKDVGSAYKSNGKDVRARDIQMLFADASTGAHSPALVRQGQISELINAKPKARRRILEEAAGISGLYQRRHEAELKLKGAETNLARVDDVLEQLASQLTQLARQAKQAARYRTIGEELRKAEGLLLYRRWKEADTTRSEAMALLTERSKDAAQAEKNARDLIKAREKSEDQLPPLREEEAIASAVLQRLTVQLDTLTDQENQAADTIARLTRRIEQLTHDIARESGLDVDANETIDRLSWEFKQLEKASDGHDAKLEEAESSAREAAAFLQNREAELTERTEDVARLSARHQSAQRLLEDTRLALEKNETEAQTARDAQGTAKDTLSTAVAQLSAAKMALEAAAAEAASSETAITTAEASRAKLAVEETEARSKRAEAEGVCTALKAELTALKRLVERDQDQEGQLLSEVTVMPGFERAFGAVFEDELHAPRITKDGQTGWVTLPDLPHAALPQGASPLGAKVEGPTELNRRLSQVGIVSPELGDDLQRNLAAGQSLVSGQGDFWRWDGYRVNADDASSSAAIRLEQLNRLSLLQVDFDAAEAQAESAIGAHDQLEAQLSQAVSAEKEAREARRKADQQVSEANRDLSRAEAEQNIAESKLESLALNVARFDEEALSARERLREAETGFSGLGDLTEARAEVEALKLSVEATRISMMSKRAGFDEIRREGEQRLKRSQEITKEISGWRHRLDTAKKRAEELTERKAQSEAELKAANFAPNEIKAKRDEIAEAISAAETRCKAASDALHIGEAALRDAVTAERDQERLASDAREARARAEARRDAARETVQYAEARIEEEMGLRPDALLEALDVNPDEMPESDIIEADVNRLKRQRDALGAVNLRAEEDAKEIQEEHDILWGEKGDLEEAIKKLRTGIAGLNREGRERLLAAFDTVNENFGVLFKHLFGGGEARLVLVESDDPLEAGLEIMCQPPGKKLATLSLLSGGEQTLTALALIFAVFLANPAPICVLDEVDAPLDDANVTRFCDLLDEMTRRTNTRFLIITHHAVTMARMDRLFGVTMAEQGVSQLVSVDLKDAEKMVA